ncbi:phage portal [Lentilactobacillus kosonis]|uniref:Phage portal n=1 Tax=Lentilactobacillus kosonis TaxID=2810561 RepID=A0A401FPR6_9LACO|nr:phage portal [Lentilactobacillus kosonis]
MAESNDLSAHMRSLNMLPKGKERRTGSRYAFNANQEYQIPISAWEKLEPASTDWIEFIQWYVNDHFSYQQPRILELERYYQADNNIHYWISKNQKKNRADNRIASAIARYITNIQVGYEFGTPLKFGYTNSKDENDNGEEILNELDVFNQQNNEPYHEKSWVRTYLTLVGLMSCCMYQKARQRLKSNLLTLIQHLLFIAQILSRLNCLAFVIIQSTLKDKLIIKLKSIPLLTRITLRLVALRMLIGS